MQIEVEETPEFEPYDPDAFTNPNLRLARQYSNITTIKQV